MIIQFFTETFVAMALGYFFGKWLDSLIFSEQIILTYVFLILGIFAGLRNFIVRAIAFTKGGNDETKDQRD